MAATEKQTLWLCKYCDHAPFHRAGFLTRHMEREHGGDNVALFNRDMTFRQLVRKSTRVAKAIKAAAQWTYDDVWKACYDGTIDLLLSGQPTTYRNIRREAYRALIHTHETSLDEMMLDSEDVEALPDAYLVSHAYAMPDAAYMLAESLGEIAVGKYGIDEPTLWLGMAENAPQAVILTGYDALLANVEDALEVRQLANREESVQRMRDAGKRGGRPRKLTA